MRAYELTEQDIIVEAPSDEVMKELEKQFGFENFKRMSGNRFAVLVPGSERNKVMAQLANMEGAERVTVSGNSLGGVSYKGSTILVKPAGRQGVQSAGLDNEQHLIETINRFVNEYGPLDITFVGDNGVSITAEDVTKAVSVGSDTKNRKKSDVNLISGNQLIPISIKKRSAEAWESADTYLGPKADELVERLVAQKKVELTTVGKQRADGTEFVSISPEVAVETTDKQTLDFVFGSDILSGNGGVIKETFEDEHYVLEGNNLKITVDVVIKKPEDIPEKMKVYILIRNDSTRGRKNSKYPGLRVLASYASRVRNALKLDSSWMQ